MTTNYEVSKDKLKLANREFHYDEAFQTKPIGYYKDAFNRFKKNKASVIAAIVVIFLIFMTLIGPLMKPNTFYEKHVTHALKIVSQTELPPKIKGLEWIPLFNGRRNITRSNIALDLAPLESPAIVERYGRILYTNLDNLQARPDGTYTVSVDFYNYVNYVLSSNSMMLTTEELQAAFDYEAASGETIVYQEVTVWRDGEGNLVPGQSHRVRVYYFDFLKNVLDFEPEYWFGVDQRGRDWFSIMWEGARFSLAVAVIIASINIAIGLIVGSISGYYGGLVDLIIERISEVLNAIPFLALITLLLLRFGQEVWVVIFAFTFTGWLGVASLTRVQFYRYKNREYVLAARTLGAGDFRIMYRHILPNAIGTLITSFVLIIPGVIFTESTFSYLGIINYGDFVSLGRMLSDSRSRLMVETSLGFLVLFPSIFVALLMLSFNLFGNGLRDAFNPSLRGVEE